MTINGIAYRVYNSSTMTQSKANAKAAYFRKEGCTAKVVGVYLGGAVYGTIEYACCYKPKYGSIRSH